jgi:hypothetical protein
MIILDTEHISELQRGGSRLGATLRARLDVSGDPDIVTTIISVEENMRGWLAEIA